MAVSITGPTAKLGGPVMPGTVHRDSRNSFQTRLKKNRANRIEIHQGLTEEMHFM